MGEQRTAIVVGGGIGGLATAVALSGRGWRVEVLERAPEFGEVGAGLSVWPNGVRALDALGIGEQVRSRAMTETQAGLRDWSGKWLLRTDIKEMDRRYGPLVMIHRANLLAILREAVSGASLRAGVTVKGVLAAGRQVEVVHDAGAARADLVVGADGLHSAVRRSLWPQTPEPRYVGYTAWRLLVDPSAPLDAGGESLGHGERIGLAPLPDRRVYMFGVANAPAGERSPDGELAELRRRFAGWHDPIPALLERAEQDAVMRHDLYELPPLKTFVSGRTALLGDAAHAMTPNLGQGACQALEDAVTLAALLDRHPTVEAALDAYDRERRPRTQLIARRSHLIGTVAQWSHRPTVALRNQIMSRTPPSLILHSLAPVLNWHPPT